MEKEKARLELIEKHIEESDYHLKKIKKSFRWKVGDTVARAIEFCLFRKKTKLSIDYLTEHFDSIRQLTQSTTNNTENNALAWPNHFAIHTSRKIGIHVSEKKADSIFGDVHVGADLKIALEKEGHEVELLDKNDNATNYELQFFMLWDTPVPEDKKEETCWIAWIRNYPDRWITNPICSQIDLFLCSSQKIVDYVKKYYPEIPVYLFPIAANIEFFKAKALDPATSKITFIGNKFKEKRGLEDFIENGNYPVDVYGGGWKKNSQGPVPRSKIPAIYSASSIILDSANQTTKEYESLNSRIFEAIASKRLVITDSEAATKLFKAKIPTYSAPKELAKCIDQFLKDETEYLQLTDLLHKELMAKHTYERRAKELKLILGKKLKIRIKIAATQENKKYFGDYYYAKELKKSFEYYGHQVSIDCYEDWYDSSNVDAELVLVLRGLKRYKPIKAQTNFLWIISHPTEVEADEIADYNSVFVASDFHYSKLKKEGLKEVDLLLQCTNTSAFKVLDNPRKKKLLFIGNTRNVFRKAVQFAIDSGFDIDVYGQGWEAFIDAKYIKGEFVENIDLPAMYNKYEILLNDHWDDMLDFGYISNRIFDALSCGIKIISDKPVGIENHFSSIYYYDDLNSFQKAVADCSSDISTATPFAHLEVSNKHSFQERVITILSKFY